MTERTTLYRKLIYAVVMAGLLFPLSWLGSPLTVERAPDGSMAASSGGRLATFRSENGLSQGNLGEIDPASETLKLATLGLRGVAVNMLWNKANEFKMKEDWGNLTATLEQLAKLQPNYITFWKYQAWNLTYNVSVEFDDYRDRYFYVRRGINFLKKGETYNRQNPQILWELGWFIGQKIGRADEKEQYRRLFKNDQEFHPDDRPLEERDNWLVGKKWYRKAEAAAEKRGIGRKSPVVFYSSMPKNQINYADAIEEEGRFDRGLPAWRLAGQEWDDYGNLSLEHSTGVILSLNEEDFLAKELADARQQLRDLAPEVTGSYFDKLRTDLTPEQRKAYDTPAEERTAQQLELAYQAERRLTPSDDDIVKLIVDKRPKLAVKARRQGKEIEVLSDRHRKTQNYKQTANFDYWKLRCEFEQTPDAINARKLCYQGKVAMVQDADPVRSAELYAQGLAKWRAVLDAFPALSDGDGTTGDDIMVFIKQYAEVLGKIDEDIPDDFPLWDVIEFFDSDQDFTQELQEHKRRSGQAGDGQSSNQPAPAEEDAEEADSGEAKPPAEDKPADEPPAE